jgi:hypothetical protein
MNSHKSFRFKFFLPDARLLAKDEIEEMLSAERIQSSAAAKKDGLWIEVTCPDTSCISEDGRITLPPEEPDDQEKGIFLKLFCPEGNCEISQSTDIP